MRRTQKFPINNETGETEVPRVWGSLQEGAAHGGFSESYLSKCIKDGVGPPVVRISRNCVRIKFADIDSWIANGGPSGVKGGSHVG